MAENPATKNRLRSLSRKRTELLHLLRDQEYVSVWKITPRPRAIGVGMPTSWAQQRLWFIDQIAQGTAAYNTGLSVRLRGTLDLQSFQMALNHIVRRHEILRTTFECPGGEPVQKVSADGRCDLKVIDLSGYEWAERTVQLRSHKVEEAREKFDLTTGPLIRCRLLILGGELSVLLVSMHHIVADGWSVRVFLEEFSELYDAHRQRRSDTLRDLPIQYADYAVWQRTMFEGKALEHQLESWRERLRGIPPQLELPSDRPRPLVQSFRGDNVAVVLDAQLHARLKSFARLHRITMFMLLCAGWAILLSRLSGQEIIAIGTPVAGRRRPELEGLIGLFANTLVLRVDVCGSSPIRDLIDHVRETTLWSYDHQDVPFERIVEALHPERSLGRNPVFQVMFSLQSTPKWESQIPGLSVSREGEVYETAILDLFLSLEEQDEQLVGSLNFATALFDRESVERWASSFVLLMRGIVDAADRRICDLPLLSEEERKAVIGSASETRVPYSPQTTIHELFEQQVARSPDATALEHERRSMTYLELNERANQLARFLRSRGLGPDRLAAVCVERDLTMVIVLLAILKAGGAYVPLDHAYPPDRLRYVIEDASPHVIITQDSLMSALRTTTTDLISLDSCWPDVVGIEKGNLALDERQLSSRNLAYVIYTSGSTGNPKGVMVEHMAVVNFLTSMQRKPGMGPADCLLAVTTLAFDIAALEIYLPLISGAKVVLASRETASDAQLLMRVLEDSRITALQATPATWQLLVNGGWSGRANLTAMCGGESLSAELSAQLLKRVRALWNLYGPTETTIWSCRFQVRAQGMRGPTESLGGPIDNTTVFVLDSYLQPVPIGVVGEIFIGGAGVARGYFKRPALSATRFIANVISEGEIGRLYKTGDLGRWRSDGILEYLGRNDDQVKLRGYRIEPGEIEEQLRKIAQVKDAVVIAREAIAEERQLVAYIASVDEGRPTTHGVREYLNRLLPAHMIPSAFVFLDCLPLTPNGKVDRRALPAPDLGAYVTRQYEPPQGELEQMLATIWQELLHIERVGREDNFFELGGHSLHGVKLIAKVAERCRVPLPAIVMFQYPTIALMATIIASHQSVGTHTIEGASVEYEEGSI